MDEFGLEKLSWAIQPGLLNSCNGLLGSTAISVSKTCQQTSYNFKHSSVPYFLESQIYTKFKQDLLAKMVKLWYREDSSIKLHDFTHVNFKVDGHGACFCSDGIQVLLIPTEGSKQSTLCRIPRDKGRHSIINHDVVLMREEKKKCPMLPLRGVKYKTINQSFRFQSVI